MPYLGTGNLTEKEKLKRRKDQEAEVALEVLVIRRAKRTRKKEVTVRIEIVETLQPR